MKPRDFHKLAILRGEARGYTTAVPSKKHYKRSTKAKAAWKKLWQ